MVSVSQQIVSAVLTVTALVLVSLLIRLKIKIGRAITEAWLAVEAATHIRSEVVGELDPRVVPSSLRSSVPRSGST